MLSWFQKYQFIINFTKLRGYWVKEHLITMKKETSKIHTKLYCIINKVVRKIIHVRVCKKKNKQKNNIRLICIIWNQLWSGEANVNSTWIRESKPAGFCQHVSFNVSSSTVSPTVWIICKYSSGGQHKAEEPT